MQCTRSPCFSRFGEQERIVSFEISRMLQEEDKENILEAFYGDFQHTDFAEQYVRCRTWNPGNPLRNITTGKAD